ncbi:MBOAT family protein [Candidatus Woesearchaeota archaeon]|nr:MBOAT family protein [Candidatus Woesearchaeota archaeon]
MQIISFQFILFFIIISILHYSVSQRFRWITLLAASIYFYTRSTNYLFDSLMLSGLILINYFTAIAIFRDVNRFRRKLALAFCITLNILPIFLYKAGLHPVPDVSTFFLLVPLGLSFVTFTQISYIIDAYTRKTHPEKHIGIYSLYVLFFPKIASGPIERAKNMLHQLKAKNSFDETRVSSGIRLVLWGAFKKTLIVPLLALFVNHAYGSPQNHAGLVLAAATLFYTFQIYYDFSAYTDIAIGLARILGYNLSQNFRLPYFADSIAEFWKRWHITLSSWTRDYIYIPLGGNRVTVPRHYLNILVVFLVIGLWHGFELTFITWGLLHASAMIFTFMISGIRARMTSKLGLAKNSSLMRALGIAATFLFVAFSWIFFRAYTLSDAVYIATHMFSLTGKGSLPYLIEFFGAYELLIGIAAIVIVELIHSLQHSGKPFFQKLPVWARWATYLIAAWAVILALQLADSVEDQFIYQRF